MEKKSWRGVIGVFRKKKVLILILMLLIGVWGFWYGNQELNASLMEEKGLIRLHVIAHSDSVHDQKTKLLVRDEVIKYMAPYLQKAKTIEEAREATLAHLPEIKKVADNCLVSLGEKYKSSAELGNYNFPTKAYGDLVLPSGKYEALRVVLGEGKGRNWWCVLYPPLCFIDISSTFAVNVRDISDFSQSQGEVEQVNANPAQVVVRFKLWEKAQNFFDKKQLAKEY
jgi:stage II sporulation protein R